MTLLVFRVEGIRFVSVKYYILHDIRFFIIDANHITLGSIKMKGEKEELVNSRP